MSVFLRDEVMLPDELLMSKPTVFPFIFILLKYGIHRSTMDDLFIKLGSD